MIIKDFKELTDFIYSEVDKRNEYFGTTSPSKNFLKSTENELHKYAKLYYKPLLQSAKFNVKLQRALDTMPHGRVWRFFHKRLWYHVQQHIEANSSKPSPVPEPTAPESLYPEVVRPIEPSRVSDV